MQSGQHLRDARGEHDRAVYPLDVGEQRSIAAPPCPVCAATRARPRFAIEGIAARIVLCGGCGLGRLHPLPSPREVAAFYPPAYYGEQGHKFRGVAEVLVRLVGARHARFLSGDLAPGARVLDVGCGRGVLLGSLADRGFEVHGVEVNDAAARGADPRAHIRVVADLAEARYPDGHFDQVIVWHVLEHVPEPGRMLAEIHRILRPGGRLVVAVPNFSSLQARWAGSAWFHLDPPRHLYHFPLQALGRLIARAGFRRVATHHFSLRQNPFGWLQSYLNRRPGWPRNGLYELMHERPPGAAEPFDPRTRRRLRLAYWLGMPPALLLAAACASLRSGATVHVVAVRARGE